ncbi:fimbrial biogenesis chaperone [Cupriavidus agavae]|uniref:Chaperone protein EcpD n=1 Tax=Cupriavidus agavae TaxID=1001822 RepID=A0A4Q7SAP2_9BURK|nr:fimbria/pilus periplasmic chaperone [Cupriavidus agavae]RZT42957.1 chaperone protein EcpD [Cupriavidus agavae]
MSCIAKIRAPLAGLLLALAAHSTSASVVLTGTRVVYPAEDHEVTVKLTNEGQAPALVQAWIDDGDAGTAPDESTAPFLIAPPLFRLEPQKGQSLRIIALDTSQPADRESVYYLNVLEVPPMGDASGDTASNTLQFALRSRVKLFYRPTGLAGRADDAPTRVTWRFARNAEGRPVLAAHNPSAFHITFTRVHATLGAREFSNADGGMVAPGGTMEFAVGDGAPAEGQPDRVRFITINDFGADATAEYEPRRTGAAAR